MAELNKAIKAPKASFRKGGSLYFLLIPGMFLVFLFNYLPMYGLVIGFKDYNIFAEGGPIAAMFSSPWVGLEHWNKLWKNREFIRAVGNTFIISGMKLLIGFPIPILLALMINEIKNRHFKRTLQTVVYLPHFMSWVVVGAIFMSLLGTTGIVNTVIRALGGDTQKFFMDNAWFRWVLLFTSVWKESGWNTIVYLAAITSIDPALYEAATIDRASRFQQVWYITLPSIAGTIVMMLILRLGGLMDAGFSQILVMYNPAVYKSSDIIGTYVYRVGLGKLNWSQGTIVGMFNSVVNFVLVMSGNMLSRKISGRSIW